MEKVDMRSIKSRPDTPFDLASPFGQASRVLAVDDDERNLQALSEVLKDIAEIVCVRSGEEALRCLLKDEFAVILLDVLMPGLDGYETAKVIRQREQTKRTPIIFLTAINKEDAHMLRGYDAGAVDFVFKPFDQVVIQSKVAVFVDLFEKTRAIEQKAVVERRLMEENLREKSERLAVEKALRKSEERQEVILRSLPVCVYSRDLTPPYEAHFISEAVERLTNFPAKRFTSDPEFWLNGVHPDDLHGFVESMNDARKSGSFSCEFRWRCADDTYRIFLDQGVLSTDLEGGGSELFGTLLDITERRQLEDQLMHSQRLDAVGKLTGGIAHDFNNLLASILSGLALLERRAQFTDESMQIVHMMQHAAKQGAELVNRMLTFSRRQRLKPASTHLSSLAETIDGLVAPVLGGLIKFDWNIERSLWPAYVDSSQLELAMLNLIFNARDAMPSGGVISVSGANHSLSESTTDLLAGDYVVLKVEDNGSGISQDLIARVIEPFFTTKEVGKGTGLGLSTVYGFAKQSGGTLMIDSEVGRGTCIEIWLPRAAENGARPTEIADPIKESRIHNSRKPPVVLLVEDSSSLREITSKLLEDSGFEVITASDGLEAKERLADGVERIDLILTDFAMPQISGLEVVRFARKLRQDWPAIIISGYADVNDIRDRPLDVPLLSKPVSDSILINALWSALEST